MKYTFEVNCHENENVITIEIAFGSSANSVRRTISFEGGADYDAPALNELISDMVDNIRLTVKEREEAIYNAGVLRWYIQQYGHDTDTKKEEQMIVEREDHSVLGDPDKYIK